ncbi:hypothetical protein PACTADRAFT_36815 [Pachysolen tannophilus NRRL Y-2460]|uniref:Phosphatidylglycerol/phosphatidylinositol transfer protein n=1 Tax=Pachysolen tannophilus NRRL Y-2460 TaxID=669874 RepID=A0A1E4U2J8_PACTA|nr:hypothetical protein PACTADRAFT_36815 [Pachysolen tannophilus NRRL Y-2460]
MAEVNRYCLLFLLFVSTIVALPFNVISPFLKEVAAALPGEKPVPGDSPVSICDSDQAQILSLTSLVISPNPPVRNANLTISALGVLDKTIEDGAYVEVDVRYGYIKLLHQIFDICEEIQQVNMTCPIEKGEHDITKEVEIPNEVPPGKYVVYARAYTKDDEFIACITGTVEFPIQNGIFGF